MKQVALITGASSGIGLELARIHAQKGRDLILIARSKSKLDEIKNQLEKEQHVKVVVIDLDLSQPGAARILYENVVNLNIQVEYLINNAGFGDFGLFHERPWPKTQQMMQLNMLALTELSYLFGQEMIKHRIGKIMNVASTAAFQPGPLMSVYYASKHYVLALSEGLANEWKDFGVSVTALCPGPTASGFQSGSEMEESKLVKGKKLPSPGEVAAYGYQMMEREKTVAIHGTLNKIMAQSVALLPRDMVTGMVRKMQEK